MLAEPLPADLASLDGDSIEMGDTVFEVVCLVGDHVDLSMVATLR